MRQILKQRLIGVTVIWAVAVIFLPMMFDETVENPHQNDFSIPKFPADFEDHEKDRPPATERLSKTKTSKKPRSEIKPEDIALRKNAGSTTKKGKSPTAWVVQAGSFGQQSNAKAFRDKLRKKGYPAFMETIAGQGSRLYRVRVGPELDRKRAEDQRAKLEEAFGIKGLVVSYP